MHRHPNPACDGAGERRFWTQGQGREAPVPRARSPGGARTSQGHRGKCPHKQNPEGGAQSRARGSCRRVALSKLLAPCLGFPSWGLEQPGWPRCPLHTVPSPSSVGPRVDTRMAGPTGRGRGRASHPVHGDDSETSASQPLRRAEPHPGLCARRPSAHLRPHARDEPLGSAPGLRVELGLPLLAPVCNDHGGRGRPPRRLTPRPLLRRAAPHRRLGLHGRWRPRWAEATPTGAPREQGRHRAALDHGCWPHGLGGKEVAPCPPLHPESRTAPLGGVVLRPWLRWRNGGTGHPVTCLEPVPLKPAGRGCSGQRRLAAG